jgi:NAD+ synthase (glutamine-hydrolysing)
VEWWNRATPEENLAWFLDGSLAERIGYSGRIEALFATPGDFIADLERWWNQYQGMAIAKRIQAPPILAIKRRAFGFDHREAQIGPRYTRKYGELKAQALGRA